MKLADYLLLAGIAVIVFFAVRSIVHRKRAGKCIGCSGDCSACQKHTK